jgi:hypothetical protein
MPIRPALADLLISIHLQILEKLEVEQGSDLAGLMASPLSHAFLAQA